MSAPALELLMDATALPPVPGAQTRAEPSRFLATLAGALGRPDGTPASPLDELLASLESELPRSPGETSPHPALGQILASLVGAETRVARLSEMARPAQAVQGVVGSSGRADALPPQTPPGPAGSMATANPLPALPVDVLRALQAPVPENPPGAAPDAPPNASAHANATVNASRANGAVDRPSLANVFADLQDRSAVGARDERAGSSHPISAERSAERELTAPVRAAAERPDLSALAQRADASRAPGDRAAAPPEADPRTLASGSDARSGLGDESPRNFQEPPSRQAPLDFAQRVPASRSESAALAPVPVIDGAREGAADPALRAPVPASRASEALQAHVERLSQGEGGSARIRLSPANLGELQLHVRVRGQSVEVTVVAQEAAARVLVEGGREQLADALASRELRMDSFDVQGGSRDVSDGPARDARGDAGSREDRDLADARNQRRARDESERGSSGTAPGDERTNTRPADESTERRVHWVV